MTNILMLAKDAADYTRLFTDANLPGAVWLSPNEPYSECEIVFGEPNLIRDALPQLPKLKWVQSAWAGVDPLLDPRLRRDYQLTNARGVFGRLMSEYVFGYLLLHERKILQRLEAQKISRWDHSLTGTLYGKTIGLLGVGSIGAEVARTAKFFGMTVRGYTRSSQDSSFVDTYYHGSTLLEFARGLDYLVSILPNTAATRGTVNAALLSQLPQRAVLINVGRGSAVDESALCTALQNGSLAAAVLDVFIDEPLPPDHPLWTTPNTFITSHTSAPSFPVDIANVFIENYQRYITGQPLKYLVNFERGY
jgi:phosphoglycerate dehydrogenase-like enzyme